ncbi:MAG: glycosyltransferase family 4 protein [Candidatus Moranbacteria bacterium]|nr:glycosyltransferase family 4 protein [Candidatus Moranbacteria bacterium]
MPKKILLYTRPIIPPWDEASKNLAWDLAKNSSGNFHFNLLTTKQKGVDIEKISGHNKLSQRRSSERFQDFLNKNNNDRITLLPIFSSPRLGKKEKLQMLMFLRSISSKKFDIIHFLFTPRPLTSFLIRRQLKKPQIKTIQTIATINKELFGKPRKLKKLLFADKIIAQSEFTYKKLKKAGLENTELIYPAIDLDKFRPKEKDVTLLKRFSLEPNDFIILFPGEYVRLKAVDDILKAFEMINKDRPERNYKLILACRIKSKKDEKKMLQTKKRSERLGLSKNIVFIETFDEMPKLYNIADLIIFPVREMTGKFDLPLALIEAMACQKPVLVSDIPVLQEFVKEGKTGFVTPKADPQKLAEKIEKIEQEKEIGARIAKNGLDFVLDNFDIKKNVKKYEDLYQKL